jgi:hypothetical protein
MPHHIGSVQRWIQDFLHGAVPTPKNDVSRNTRRIVKTLQKKATVYIWQIFLLLGLELYYFKKFGFKNLMSAAATSRVVQSPLEPPLMYKGCHIASPSVCSPKVAVT